MLFVSFAFFVVSAAGTARFGMLVDRFGIRWMINCDEAPEASA